MLMRFILLLCGGLLLPVVSLGGSFDKPSPVQTSSLQLSSRTVDLPSNAQRFRFHGRMNVKILAGLPEHDMRIIGSPLAVSGLQTRVEGNIVDMSASPVLLSKFATPLTVIIRTSNVYSLSFNGNGDLEGVDLNTPHLELKLHNQGKVNLAAANMGLTELQAQGPSQVVLRGVNSKHFSAQIGGNTCVVLRGEVALQQLTLDDAAKFDAQWVQGYKLKLLAAGQSQVQLAGTVGTLEMTVRNQATVNARYLRTLENYVKTYNQATVMIQTSKHQYTLARDTSNIYYFKSPFFKADMMASWGSVLDFNGMA